MCRVTEKSNFTHSGRKKIYSNESIFYQELQVSFFKSIRVKKESAFTYPSVWACPFEIRFPAEASEWCPFGEAPLGSRGCRGTSVRGQWHRRCSCCSEGSKPKPNRPRPGRSPSPSFCSAATTTLLSRSTGSRLLQVKDGKKQLFLASKSLAIYENVPSSTKFGGQ